MLVERFSVPLEADPTRNGALARIYYYVLGYKAHVGVRRACFFDNFRVVDVRVQLLVMGDC
jgi:hypothetical protein